jgi:RNA polymerase sigma-70 factor (ECF subfamily)
VDLQALARRSASEADDVLVRRAAAGEIAAFDALVLPRRQRCYRLARSILANEADAADATQDALFAAWRKLPRLRDTGAFDGWLTRIVANTSLMARRHRKRLREVSDSLEASDSDESSTWEPASVAGQDESDAYVEREAMGRAFDRLSPADRAILVLHHLHDRPVIEVARRLHIPVGTAKWRLHAARKALERAMEAES